MCNHCLCFQLDTLYSVSLNNSSCKSASGPSLGLCKYFNVIYPIGLSLCSYILIQNYFASLHQVNGLCSCIILLFVNRIFLEYPLLFVMFDSVSVSFKSSFFRQSFDSSLQVVLSDLFAVFIRHFHPKIFLHCFSFLSIFACCRNLFTCPSSVFSYSDLYFCSSSFGVLRFYHKLISQQHKLARLVQRCCPLGYL